jgi:hypothetical protein
MRISAAAPIRIAGEGKPVACYQSLVRAMQRPLFVQET